MVRLDDGLPAPMGGGAPRRPRRHMDAGHTSSPRPRRSLEMSRGYDAGWRARPDPLASLRRRLDRAERTIRDLGEAVAALRADRPSHEQPTREPSDTERPA